MRAVSYTHLGVSLMLLFVFFAARMNFEFGFVTLIIAHITFDVPYVILNIMPKFRQMNPHLYEAAQDLGCSPVSAFFKVVLPEILPGVISGFLMSFTFSLDDFVISYFTSGATSQTCLLYTSFLRYAFVYVLSRHNINNGKTR